jgi:predicted RecB family endonuclease
LLLHRDGIVEVLGRLRVDREAELVAEVDAVARIRVGILVRLEIGAGA